MKTLPLALLLATTTLIQAEERSIKFSASEFIPKMKEIAVTKAGEPGPGKDKFKPLAKTAKYGEAIKLDSEVAVDIWWTPAEGIPIRIVEGKKFNKADEEIKIHDRVGIVTLRGDGLPRAALVTITSQDDPGPDEKGHVPVQIAKDFKIEMLVPEGFYAIWVSPDSGARAKKVNDRFRVVAGKEINLD